MSPKQSAILTAAHELISEHKLPTLDQVRGRLAHPGRASSFRSVVEGMESIGLCSLTPVTEETRPLGLKGPNPTFITPKGLDPDQILQGFVPTSTKGKQSARVS